MSRSTVLRRWKGIRTLFPDTLESEQHRMIQVCGVLGFKFGRADVPRVGVAPLAVVELLQIGKNMLPGNVPGRVRRPIAFFAFEAGKTSPCRSTKCCGDRLNAP